MLPLIDESRAIQENLIYTKQQKKDKFSDVNKRIMAIQALPEKELEMKIENLDWQKIAEAVWAFFLFRLLSFSFC